MNKNMKTRTRVGTRSALLVVSIALLAVGCSRSSQEVGVRSQGVNLQASATPTPAVNAEVRPEYIKYRGEDGKNVLDLLKMGQQVTVKTFEGVGEFVNGINGLESDGKHFWSFYVNGAQATVGANRYITKTTDTIEWKFEAIK